MGEVLDCLSLDRQAFRGGPGTGYEAQRAELRAYRRRRHTLSLDGPPTGLHEATTGNQP